MIQEEANVQKTFKDQYQSVTKQMQVVFFICGAQFKCNGTPGCLLGFNFTDPQYTKPCKRCISASDGICWHFLQD